MSSLQDRSNPLQGKYRTVYTSLVLVCLTVLLLAAAAADCVIEVKGILFEPVIHQLLTLIIYCVLPVLAILSLLHNFKSGVIKLGLFVAMFLLCFAQLTRASSIWYDAIDPVSLFGYDINILVLVPNFETAAFTVLCLIIATKGMSFRTIAKIFVISQTVLLMTVTVLALTGIIPDMVFEEVGRPDRHSLGLHYPLNYVARWFSVALVYCYLKNGLLKIWDYVALLELWYISIFVCKAQTSMVMFGLLIIGTAVRQLAPKFVGRFRNVFLRFSRYSFVLFAVFMIVASLLYVPPISTALSKVTRLATFFSRLAFAHVGLTEFFPSLFGIDYPVRTWIGTRAAADYFFIDCSYVYVLLHCGIIAFIVLMAILWFIPQKIYKQGQGYGLFVVFLFAMICAMEHHLLDISVNIFWLMTFTDIVSRRKSTADNAVAVIKDHVVR